MAERELFDARRRTGIGGSDAAAVVGVGTWGSPLSVWMDKRGLSAPLDETEPMRWGRILQDPIGRAWGALEAITDLRAGTFRRHASIPYVIGHPDFLGTHPIDGPIVIETKNLQEAPEDEEGEVASLQYLLQVIHYLILTGRPVGYLVALIRGNRLRSWRIEADPDVGAGLLETYADFWRHVQEGIPPEPDGSEASADALKRLYPRHQEGLEMVATPEDQRLISDLLEVRQSLAAIEREEDELTNRIKAHMGKAERLLFPGGSVSWRTNKDGSRIDWQAVAGVYRSLIESYRGSASGRMGKDDLGALQAILSTNLDTIEGLYSVTVEGARPFRVTAKEVQG